MIFAVSYPRQREILEEMKEQEERVRTCSRDMLPKLCHVSFTHFNTYVFQGGIQC